MNSFSKNEVVFSRTGKEATYSEWWIEQQAGRVAESLSMHGVNFFVAPDVFSPSVETTNSVDLLLRNLPSVKGKRVLDIGTGCGVLALKAALEGAQSVLGTETNESALLNARANVANAHLSSVVEIVQNERFEDLASTFDVILMNIIFSERPTASDQIADLGTQSLSMHRRLLAVLPKLLAPNGVVLLGFGSFGDIDTLQQLLRDSDVQVVGFVTEEKFGVLWYAITLQRD